MILFPNAKINLGLNVLNKRTDGYHNLESVFYPIPLYDIVEFNEISKSKNGFEFICTGIPLNGKAEDNLCIKAYLLLKRNHALPDLKIHLHKNIPFGAGLGGGSADAAFLLNALNHHYQLKLSLDKRKILARELGADCVFFIENKVALVQGIGDAITPIKLTLHDFYLVLIHPGFGVSTKNAYANLRVDEPSLSSAEIIEHPVREWKASLSNDFEQSVFKQHPALSNIKNQLYQAGALFASMTGSGSAIYGIFHKKPEIESQFPVHYFVWTKKLP